MLFCWFPDLSLSHKNHWWKLEAGFELWTLHFGAWADWSRGYPVNAETPTPRSWIRCTRLLRCRCRPPEGKVTHKVGPLGSFYMWGPYKRPQKWVTYKNWLASDKKTHKIHVYIYMYMYINMQCMYKHIGVKIEYLNIYIYNNTLLYK